MEIGIVSLYPHIKDINNLENAIRLLGYKPYILDLVHSTKDKIYYLIKKSHIIHWIFSGSPLCIIDKRSTQIPLELFKLTAKRYMFICYSLESIMYQLKYPISIRYDLKKEFFNLTIDNDNIIKNKLESLYKSINFPMIMWRNHYGFVSSDYIKNNKLNYNLVEIASYQGESMILLYRNSILLQFHPERSNDGLQLINNWIRLL